MWAASEDAVTDTKMELLPSFLGLAEGWGCVTICDRVWEKGTFRAKIEFLISGTRGSAKCAL